MYNKLCTFICIYVIVSLSLSLPGQREGLEGETMCLRDRLKSQRSFARLPVPRDVS